MRCPICGAKMVNNQLCPYCKITDEQVLSSSNKKVKEYRKADKKDLIYFTNEIPKDVSRIKLIMFTIFFGIIGVNHYYVLRNIRATYSVVSVVISILFIILNFAFESMKKIVFLKLLSEISIVLIGINFLLWIFDIINVLFKKFKVPVVLGDKEKK